MCNFKVSEQELVLMHFALKHRKIIEFVPQEVAEIFYPPNEKKSTENNDLAVFHYVGEHKVSQYSILPKQCNF